MDIFGEHPSIPIGVATLIAIYLGACRVAGRRPTRRQAMWFAIAMGVILYAHTELDELADARIFSMHMLQHLIETFVIPPLLLLGTPGWMIRPWVLSKPIKPIARVLTKPVIAFLIFSAVFVTAHFPPIFDRMCRDENFHIFLHLLFMAAGMLLWWPILSPLPELPRLSYPGANPLPVSADDPDDRSGRADHARDARDLSVVHRGRARLGPQADRRPGARRSHHVDRAGHLPDDRLHIHLLPLAAARRRRHSSGARVNDTGAARGSGAFLTLAGRGSCGLVVD